MNSANKKLYALADRSAREWDSDSTVASENKSEAMNSNVAGNSNNFTLIDVSSPTEEVVNSRSKDIQSQPRATAIDYQQSSSSKQSASSFHTSVNNLESENDLNLDKTNKVASNQRVGKERKKSKSDKWGRAEGLITDRSADHQKLSAIKEAEKKMYLDPPTVDKGKFPALGCYIWPYWNESPLTLLGTGLEDLNPIRLENQVWIEFDQDSKCIIISSFQVANADVVLANAIKGIRDAVEHAKAVRVTASPLHLVQPPTSLAMTRLIKARVIEKNPPRAKKLVLIGEKLSNLEGMEWESGRDSKLSSNIQLLQNHLVKNLLRYAAVKYWMRLRIHFGNITMSRFTNEFSESGSSWAAFLEMVAAPRFSATVDPDFSDARLALLLMKNICQSPGIFCSVHGRIPLKDIRFKDTEIIHFKINDQQFRMEGEIDESFDNPNQVFQIGSNSLYRDNRRNVLIETRIIDVEKALDWKLELIADNEDKVLNLPPELQTLIKDSVPAKTRFRIDILGMRYPDVTPKPSHSVYISSVRIRSVIQYRMKESGYIIEIVIYRYWVGAATEGEPEISCNISMFHPCWDDETRDLSNKSFGRDWKNDLSNFFVGNDQYDNGLEYLLVQTRTIQEYIIQARKELTETGIKSTDIL